MAGTRPVAMSPAELWEKIQHTYQSAVDSGAATSIDNTAETVPGSCGEQEVPFILRVAAALKAKLITQASTGCVLPKVSPGSGSVPSC